MPRAWNMPDDWTAVETPWELDRACARSLADEVAIDFPSMPALVPRLLAGFADPPAPTAHVARVSLSSRQAVAGTRLPLHVLLHRTCAACGGRGETWSDACSPCAGTGASARPYPLTVTIPAGVAHGARFSFSVAHPRGRRAQVEVHVAVR